VLYYRQDILAKLNLSAEDLGTWKGFREACERLHNSKLGKTYFALPLQGQKEGILIHDLAPWIWEPAEFPELGSAFRPVS